MNIVPGYVYSIHNVHIHIPYTYEMEMYTDEDIVPIDNFNQSEYVDLDIHL